MCKDLPFWELVCPQVPLQVKLVTRRWALVESRKDLEARLLEPCLTTALSLSTLGKGGCAVSAPGAL